jgi:hypothetical protein
MYRSRLLLFIDLLKKHGMDIAVEPDAGFFTLWRVPDRAFGEEIRSAEHFNFLMMERTGLIGVHFEPHFIRYAVCADVEALGGSIGDAFSEAKVSYG